MTTDTTNTTNTTGASTHLTQIPVPTHLALIPDGNRRWARACGLPAPEGHRAGIGVVGEIVAAAWDAGVRYCTFWWGSPANLTHRAPEEVAVITGVLAQWLAGPGAALIAARGASFDALGRWRQLCPEIDPGVTAATAAAGDGPPHLTLMMAYDGRDEILAAADALGGSGGSREAFGRALWTASLPPVDLVLRTGGEPHLSAGFLMWSIAQAQLAFSERMWPDMEPDELRRILAAYASTQRRFGR